MYDVAKLKRALGYCTKLDFEDSPDGNRCVITAHFTNGMKAELLVDAMPSDTVVLIKMVEAAASQCLGEEVMRGVFKMLGQTRTITRAGDTASVVQGRKFPTVVVGAPTKKQLRASQPTLIDVDGEPAPLPNDDGTVPENARRRPESPPGKFDFEKARRAADALTSLQKVVADD